jgi:asparagine synthase (glutamine-hydrolysing)
MCGIVGIVSASPFRDPALLGEMRDTMRHRGPDDAGIWWSCDGRVGLASRRLAIIDLSPGGHQPMLDASGRLCIVQNGEIYNYQDLRTELESRGHRFRTSSDTEVLLETYRAWGLDCLSHLNGMYAFAVYDSKAQRVFLARDRAGKKPLFYWHTPRGLVFASELKAIMAEPSFPRRLNIRALGHYLAYGYVPGSMCILEGVKKLPAGHAMSYDLAANVLRTWSYWQLPPQPRESRTQIEDLGDELEALLEDSVRRRLVADVPVGILLSGGIDSSLITAMAARISPRSVKTFTISFPGHGAYDESAYARLVATHFGTDHHELAATPATVEILPRLARQYDEPIGDSSVIPTYLVSSLVRQHATVALGGDGGDELFAGYPHYNWIQWQERARQVLPASVRRFVSTGAKHWLPPWFRGRHYLTSFGADLPDTIASVNLYFDVLARHHLLSPLITGEDRLDGLPEARKASVCPSDYTPLQQATRVDFQTTMVEDYLVKVDRASMLASLEVREPWLDYRLVEFAFGRVPDALRATARKRKVLSRYVAARLLPRKLDLKRKQGFSVPLDAWFRGQWGRYVDEVLREADRNLFDQRVVQSLIASQRRGHANTNRLFALTLFELWRREYRIST